MIERARGLAVWEGLYRLFLRTLPASFRREMGPEAIQTFRDLYRAVCRTKGSLAAGRFAVTASLRVVLCAIQLRISRNARSHISPLAIPKRRGGGRIGTHLAQDTRVAFRNFHRLPGFYLTAIAIMALGIGATTAVFTIVDHVLLRALPYADADRLVYFTDPAHSIPSFLDWRDRTNAFETLAAARVLSYDLTGEERPERIRTGIVSGGFFSMFAARPSVGTLFGESTAHTTGTPVVISESKWRSTWGGDPNIVGRDITLNGEPAIIVGVMSPDFHLPEPMVGREIDAWIPFDLNDPELQNRGFFILRATARLKPSVSIESARAELNVLSEALAVEHPDRYRREDGSVRSQGIVPLYEATVSEVAGTLGMLMGAVFLMLLIACANVANLLLARGTARQREITLRIALGAGRRRIIMQLLTETVALAGAGGLLGVALAFGGVKLFVQANPVGIPRIADAAIDLRLLTFAVGVSVLTGIVFGILPALQASGNDAASVLKDGGRTAGSRRSRAVRNALVVTEIAVALVLLTGATVLFDNLLSVQRVDPGFEPGNLVTVPIGLSSKTPEQRAAFSRDVIDRISALPGVTSVGAGVTIPFVVTGGGRCCWFMDIAKPGSTEPPANSVVHPVTEGYFQTLGATMARGRAFTPRDGGLEPTPTIINASFARRLFGADDPVGQQLDMESLPLVVVGVVNDIRHWGLDEPVENDVYFPFDGSGEYFIRYYLVVKTSGSPELATPAIREAIWSVDPNIPLDALTIMTERISESIATSRFYSILMTGFATLSLLLAAGGIYGSMLYSVGQQYRELGLRLAIGARPADVIRLVLTRAGLITFIGLAIGLAGAAMLRRTIDHLVVDVGAFGWAPFVLAPVLLGMISLCASYFPARRASKTDPLSTLRFD